MKSMFALQKDASGNVVAASDFTHSYQLSDWLRKIDIQPGDNIEFRETVTRAEGDEIAPAFIETPPAMPELAAAEQPF